MSQNELTELLVFLGNVGFVVVMGETAGFVGVIASDVAAKVREAGAGHATM